jgi:hypothetical protein
MGRPRKQSSDHIPDVDDAAIMAQSTAINPELKSTLEKYPHIDCVWMNEDGTWFFADKPGFTAYSREQILNG